MTFQEHTRFRATKAWKEFRKALIIKRGPYCELCGTKYVGKRIKQLQVHHRDPENYFDLTPEKFALLDSSCHDLIERLATKLEGSKSDNIPNLEKWVSLTYLFLPFETQRIVKEKYDAYLSSKMPKGQWQSLCEESQKLFEGETKSAPEKCG